MEKVDRMALAEKLASQSLDREGEIEAEHIVDRTTQKDLSLKTGEKLVLNLGSRQASAANVKAERGRVEGGLSNDAGAKAFLPPPPPPGAIVKPTKADISNHHDISKNDDNNLNSLASAVLSCDDNDDWNDFQSGR
jgi:hypothetical protein